MGNGIVEVFPVAEAAKVCCFRRTRGGGSGGWCRPRKIDVL